MNQFLSNRHVRSVKVTSERWQRRAVFVIGGVVIGAVAVALAMLAELRFACGYAARLRAIGILDQPLLS
jgi:hypothetical protein